MKLCHVRFALSALALLAFSGAKKAASLVDGASRALIARAEPVTWIDGYRTGSAWKSVIQTPNYQTGRDVGAASVGMGLLAAYDVTGNAAYLNAASAAGDFLIAAQVPAESGRWPDFYNPGGPASYGFTSFNGGAAGIADFLWRLFERTGNARYQSSALAAMDWEMSVAQAPAGQSCPPACFWRWQDPQTRQIYTGLGDGVAGIASTFEVFAERREKLDPAQSARYAQYAQSAAAWLESQMVHVKLANGDEGAKLPEQPGTDVFDTGLRSGSAGDAFLFYRLYLGTGRTRYRHDGDLLLAWVRSQALADHSCAGVKWPIATKGYGRKLYATGVGDGNAGIGWVAIQAYRLLIGREPALAVKDLQLARASGDWLLSSCAASDRNEKAYWPETEGPKLVHTGLDNGAPGIAIFLYDLYRATGAPSYRGGADDAQRWIESVAFGSHDDTYWCEHMRDGAWQLCGEPSWRWGEAGILNMAARLQGWQLDIPGEQPGFDRRR